MRLDLTAIGMGLAFAFIWSSAFTSARIIVADAAPLAALALRFFISGLIGIGIPFDATGLISCNVPAAAEAALCPFGVIRQGPGNAGVWITLPQNQQQQLLFEDGDLVTGSPANDFNVEIESDNYLVTFGDNRFVIPEAVVFGG